MNDKEVWLAISLMIASPGVLADAVAELQARYRAQGATVFDPQAGKAIWYGTFAAPEGGKQRSCTNCHTDDLKKRGRHVRTRKPIEPMAPSVNPKRLTDAKKIEKWLLRNCKWTLGRECTPQEKGDLLEFLRNQ